MSWRAVAHKDVRDAGRSLTIWVLFLLLVGSFLLYGVGYAALEGGEFADFLEGLASLIGTLLPVLGLALGYKSIAHERSNGSIYLSLSFPHSRRDLLVGTVVGRSIVLLAPTLVALVLVGVVAALTYGIDAILPYPAFALATSLYGAAFVAIAVGLSASTTVDRWITLGAIGAYLLLVQLWDNFHTTGLLVLHRFDVSVLEEMPDWALLVRMAKPSESYYRLVRAAFDVGHAELYVTEGAPIYVGWWTAILLLAAWIVVPLALGYRRFANDDL